MTLASKISCLSFFLRAHSLPTSDISSPASGEHHSVGISAMQRSILAGRRLSILKMKGSKDSNEVTVSYTSRRGYKLRIGLSGKFQAAPLKQNP